MIFQVIGDSAVSEASAPIAESIPRGPPLGGTERNSIAGHPFDCKTLEPFEALLMSFAAASESLRNE